MSLQLQFEPHSWYFSTAIQRDTDHNDACEYTYNVDSKNCIVHGQRVHPNDTYCEGYAPKWRGYYENGMTGYIVEFYSDTLQGLKQQIKTYQIKEEARIARLYKGEN